jgi:hypothetical protein
MYSSEGANGERKMQRFVSDRLEDAVVNARAALQNNDSGAVCGVAVFDGYIRLPSGRTDALFLEMRAYGPVPVSVMMAVPYRNVDSNEGFAVFRLKLLESSVGEGETDTLVEAFWRGVDGHEKGSEVWNAHLDQSQ